MYGQKCGCYDQIFMVETGGKSWMELHRNSVTVSFSADQLLEIL